MSIPAWQPGTTYAPGALVVPRSSPPAAVVALANPTLTDATGWTLQAPLSIINDGDGYAGGGQIEPVSATPQNGVVALNNAKINAGAGQTVSASCMCRHGTSDKHSSDVAMLVAWFDANDHELLPRAVSNGGLPSLSSNNWQQISVSGTAPPNCVYARIGVALRRTGSDNIAASYFRLNYTPSAPGRATMYKATQPKPGKSAASEPVWPPVGQSVQDNEVTWQGVNLDHLVWQASPLFTSGPTEPEWPNAKGATVHDGTIDWIAVVPTVDDPNVPNNPVATIGASKIFIADNDIVRFCATNNAADWSAQYDAGYLPTGLQSASETQCTGLGLYRGNLAVFMPNTMQVWQIDPDPAQMTFMDQVPGVGTVHQRAICPMTGDLYFLSSMGVRSATISAGTANLQAGDIGTPIDELVRADLAAYGPGSDTPAWEPIAVNFPSAGQFLLFMGDHAWVFTYSPAAQLAAWSKYTLPWLVTDACVLNGDLYVRADDDCVYRLDKEAGLNGDSFVDDTADAASAYACTVRWPYLDFGNGGDLLDVYGADVLFNEGVVGDAGVTALQLGWDENDLDALTDPLPVSAVQARGADGFVPIEVSTPSVSLQVTYAGAGMWELTQANLYIGGGPRAP